MNTAGFKGLPSKCPSLKKNDITTDTLTPLFSHLFAAAVKTPLWILHSRPQQTLHCLPHYFLLNPPQAKKRIKGRKRNGAWHKNYLYHSQQPQRYHYSTGHVLQRFYHVYKATVAFLSRVQSYKHRTNEKLEQNKEICLLVHLQRVRQLAHTNSRTKSQPVTHTAMVFANHAYTTLYYATLYTKKGNIRSRWEINLRFTIRVIIYLTSRSI